MKCKIFWGKPMEAVDAFNKWAKGKALTREVLIHEQIIYIPDDGNTQILLIIVYHPEDPQWDATPQPQKIPIINIPIPQTKIEEIKVTQ